MKSQPRPIPEKYFPGLSRPAKMTTVLSARKISSAQAHHRLYSQDGSPALHSNYSIRSFARPAVVLLLAILSGCSRSAPHPASSLEAAATAREQALQKARAAAAARDQYRQDLANIPLPSKNVYLAIHTRQSWTNPFLIVGASTVNLAIMVPDVGLTEGQANMPGAELLHPAAARRRVLDLRLSDLPEALAALPENTWPFGRVIAVEEDPLAPRANRAQIRGNVEATMQILNDLGVVVDEWPQPGTR